MKYDYSDWNEAGRPTPAIVYDMPPDEYMYYPALNASDLKRFSISPAHYAYCDAFPSTRVQSLGTLIHAALLEPDRFDREYTYIDCPDKRAPAYRQALKHIPADSIVISRDAKIIDSVRNAADMNPVVMKLRAQGWCHEVSVFAAFHAQAGTVPIKCRFDALSENRCAYDLKTTHDAGKRAFDQSAAQYKYRLDEAFYRMTYGTATGEPLEDFAFFIAQTVAPYTTAVRRFPYATVIASGHECRDLIESFAACDRINTWPYPEEDGFIDPPAWEENESSYLSREPNDAGSDYE